MRLRNLLRAAGSGVLALAFVTGTASGQAPPSTTGPAGRAAAALVADGVGLAAARALGAQALVLDQLVASGTIPASRVGGAAASLLGALSRPSGATREVRPAATPPVGDCTAGSGASYDVFTGTAPGYSVESATVQLGTTANANTANDAFYASLGADTAAGSVDVGLWSPGSGTTATWYGYADGTLTGWAYSAISVPQGTDPAVILSVLVGTGALTLDVWNASTDTVIGTATFSEPGYGFSGGAGVGLYRFDSLAQNAENLADGSSLGGEAWSGATVTPAGGTTAEAVSPRLVSTAGPECSRAEQATVQVLSQTKWSASDVSIVYAAAATTGGGGGGHGGHR